MVKTFVEIYYKKKGRERKQLACFQDFSKLQYGVVTVGELFVLDPIIDRRFKNRRKKINHKP